MSMGKADFSAASVHVAKNSVHASKVQLADIKHSLVFRFCHSDKSLREATGSSWSVLHDDEAMLCRDKQVSLGLQLSDARSR